MSQYTSMAMTSGEIVDCRMLYLEFEFDQLTQSQLNNLSELCFDGMQELTDGISVSVWEWVNWHDRRKTKKKQKVLENIRQAKQSYSFSVAGYFLSDIVYDNRTLKRYEKMMNTDCTIPWASTEISVDYPDIYRELFADVSSPQRLKENLLKIFHEPERIKRAPWFGFDYSGLLCAIPQLPLDKHLYHGYFSFWVARACLGSNAIEWANQLEMLLRKIAGLIPNISGRITLSPLTWPAYSSSGHMRYFSNPICDSQRSETPHFYDRSWGPYHYLQGAEWFNLVSSVQAAHIPNVMTEAKQYEDVLAEPYSNGSLIVKSKKNILETDVSELGQIKRLLYDALYPGGRKILLQDLGRSPGEMPRSLWEYIPIFEEEISVSTDCIIFQHQRKIN